MKFFKWLFKDAPNNALALQKNASGSKPDLDYELSLLDDCKRKRNVYIESMAALQIEEIDKTIAAYEEHVNAFVPRGKVVICRIIAEKLDQLKKAREIVQRRIHDATFSQPLHQRFETGIPL